MEERGGMERRGKSWGEEGGGGLFSYLWDEIPPTCKVLIGLILSFSCVQSRLC